MANIITIVAGADFAIKYDWGTTDITGHKFFSTIKRERGQTDVQAAAKINGTATGTSITLTYTAAVTAALAGDYYLDTKVVDGTDIAIIPPDGPDTLRVVNPATIRSTT